MKLLAPMVASSRRGQRSLPSSRRRHSSRRAGTSRRTTGSSSSRHAMDVTSDESGDRSTERRLRGRGRGSRRDQAAIARPAFEEGDAPAGGIDRRTPAIAIARCGGSSPARVRSRRAELRVIPAALAGVGRGKRDRGVRRRGDRTPRRCASAGRPRWWRHRRRRPEEPPRAVSGLVTCRVFLSPPGRGVARRRLRRCRGRDRQRAPPAPRRPPSSADLRSSRRCRRAAGHAAIEEEQRHLAALVAIRSEGEPAVGRRVARQRIGARPVRSAAWPHRQARNARCGSGNSRRVAWLAGRDGRERSPSRRGRRRGRREPEPVEPLDDCVELVHRAVRRQHPARIQKSMPPDGRRQRGAAHWSPRARRFRLFQAEAADRPGDVVPEGTVAGELVLVVDRHRRGRPEDRHHRGVLIGDLEDLLERLRPDLGIGLLVGDGEVLVDVGVLEVRAVHAVLHRVRAGEEQDTDSSPASAKSG